LEFWVNGINGSPVSKSCTTLTDLIPFERVVAPGKSFDTAATSFLFYRRGTSQDPHWLIPQYVLRFIARPVSTEAPRWMYNTWEPWGGQIGSKELLGVEKKVANTGIGLFGSWRQPRSNAWDGFARFAHTGEGIIVLFRNNSDATHASVQIPGFPEEDFVVKSWGSGKEFGLKGSELRTGYMVALEKGDVTILELTKIKK